MAVHIAPSTTPAQSGGDFRLTMKRVRVIGGELCTYGGRRRTWRNPGARIHCRPSRTRRRRLARSAVRDLRGDIGLADRLVLCVRYCTVYCQGLTRDFRP